MNLYKPYIRPKTGLVTDLSDLSSFYAFQWVKEDVKWSIEESSNEKLFDLSEITTSEKISIQLSSLKASKTEYEAIRTVYHNKYCDIVLLGSPGVSLATYSVKTKVSLNFESGQSSYFAVSAELVAATEFINSHFNLFGSDLLSPIGLPDILPIEL